MGWPNRFGQCWKCNRRHTFSKSSGWQCMDGSIITSLTVPVWMNLDLHPVKDCLSNNNTPQILDQNGGVVDILIRGGYWKFNIIIITGNNGKFFRMLGCIKNIPPRSNLMYLFMFVSNTIGRIWRRVVGFIQNPNWRTSHDYSLANHIA